MKFTCCPSCNTNFANVRASAKSPSKQPLVLKCGHTFCEACLGHKVRRNTDSPLYQAQVACPTCKQITQLENGVKDLPVNVYLSAYMDINQRAKLDQQLAMGIGQFAPTSSRKVEKFKSYESKDGKCKMCLVKDGTCKCIECDSILCIGCFEKVHSISAAIRQHKPVPLAVPKFNSSGDGEELHCAEHKRVVEYFCEDDFSSICSRCYIVGSHKNHQIISFEEKNKQILGDIENELPTASLVLQNLKKVDKKMASAVPNVKSETKSLIDDINQSFMNLHALLQAREMEIIKSVTTAFKQSILSLDEQRHVLQQSRSELENALKIARKLMENNALVLDGNALLDILRNAKATPCVMVAKDVTALQSLDWCETQGQELIQAINTFGSVSGSVELRFDFKTVEEAPEEIDEDDKQSVYSVGSASSVTTASDRPSAIARASSIDTGEDVIIESEDTEADSDVSKSSKKKTDKFQQIQVTTPVVKGAPQRAMVTHIRSPNDFCVQLTCNKKQLETLTHNINTWCRREGSVKHVPKVIKTDMMVLAKYSGDKLWYRARVLNVENPAGEKGDDGLKVHVLYIDFGNDECLPLQELRTMQTRFMKYPVFSVHCSLFDIAPYEEDTPWSESAIQEFHHITQNQIFLLSALVKHEAVFEVDLVCMPTENVLDDNYVSVRDILIFLEVARFRTFSDAAKQTATLPSYPKIDFIKPTAVGNGKTVDVTVTCVKSPWNFHIACNREEQAYYSNMMEEMQEMYGKDALNIYSLFYPQEGIVCSVQADDGNWYRAKVLSPPAHKKVTVNLVDVGSVITVHYDRLKKLHSSFVKLPAQATACRLADICPLGGPGANWTSDVELWCQNTMIGASGRARIIRYGECTEVVLWLGSKASIQRAQSINYILVEKGKAQSTGLAAAGMSQDITATRATHRYNGQENLHATEEQYQETSVTLKPRPTSTSSSSSSTLTSPQKQSPFISPAQSPTTKAGKPDHSPQTHSTPVKPSSKPQKNKNTGVKKNLSSQSTKKSPKSKSLPDEKTKIQQEIHKAMCAAGETPPSSSDKDSMYIEVIVVSYKSPSDFFIRLQEKEEELQSLMEDMQACYGDSLPSPPRQWDVGQYCAAKYSEDGQWYRGEIKKIVSADIYTIEMVDYGYTEEVKCSNMRPLSRELGKKIYSAAVRCHLANMVPAGSVDVTKWSRTAVEFMARSIKDKKLYVKLEGEKGDIGLPIDIIVEDKIPETAFEPATRTYHSLRQAILDQGLAMPTKKQPHTPSPDSEGLNPFQKAIFEKNSQSPNTEKLQVEEEETSRDSGNGASIPVTPNKAPASEPDDGGAKKRKKSLHRTPTLCLPPYPVPDVGTELTVLPTFVDMDGVIYAQPLDWEGKIVHLSSELQRIYTEQECSALSIAWKLGQLCVAFFPDDSQWYRALILEIGKGEVKVRYIDFGNAAWVKLDCLREMLPVFADEHALAYYCVLHDIEPNANGGTWPVPVLDHIHELVVNCECNITVMGVEDSLLLQVQLTKPNGVNLNEHLVANRFVVSCSDITELYEQSQIIGQVLINQNPYQQLDVGGVGDTFKAVMVHVELPNLVYLQRARLPEPDGSDFVAASEVAEINSAINEFEEMAEKLKLTNSMPMSQLPDVGLMCAGKFSVDDQWYRALCVKCYPKIDSCFVVYVDYGTAEVVHRTRLRLLPTEFWSFPAQALRCYFNIVPPSGPKGKWTRPSITGVIQVLAGKELTVKIMQLKPLTVELLVEEGGEMRLAYEKLIEAGLALLPQDVDALMLIHKEAVENEDRDVIVESDGGEDQKETDSGSVHTDSFKTPEKADRDVKVKDVNGKVESSDDDSDDDDDEDSDDVEWTTDEEQGEDVGVKEEEVGVKEEEKTEEVVVDSVDESKKSEDKTENSAAVESSMDDVKLESGETDLTKKEDESNT